MTMQLPNQNPPRFVLVEPDEEIARDILHVLERHSVHAMRAVGHLQALALTEDHPVACMLIAARGIDIAGVDLCALIRSREDRRLGDSCYIVVYGLPADLEAVFVSPFHVDDCIAAPWSEAELHWKLSRAVRTVIGRRKSRASRHRDDGTGLLTPEGLEAFVHEEVNRVGRRHGWFSLSALSIRGLENLRASYGRTWLEWFTADIWIYLRRQLRNYDRLAAMGNGYLGLVSPDLDEQGTLNLLQRLSGSMSDFALHSAPDAASRLGLAARYLCVRVLGDYRQFDLAGDALWAWLRDNLHESPSAGVKGQIGTVSLTLDLESGFQPNA